jgi:hypothetical protein
VAVLTGAVLLLAAPAAAALDGNYLDDPAQLVVGDPAALTTGDLALKGELEDMGYAVTVVDDTAAATADAGTAVVLVAASADGAALAAKYKNVTAPVVTLANGGWDD